MVEIHDKWYYYYTFLSFNSTTTFVVSISYHQIRYKCQV